MTSNCLAMPVVSRLQMGSEAIAHILKTDAKRSSEERVIPIRQH